MKTYTDKLNAAARLKTQIRNAELVISGGKGFVPPKASYDDSVVGFMAKVYTALGVRLRAIDCQSDCIPPDIIVSLTKEALEKSKAVMREYENRLEYINEDAKPIEKNWDKLQKAELERQEYFSNIN